MILPPANDPITSFHRQRAMLGAQARPHPLAGQSAVPVVSARISQISPVVHANDRKNGMSTLITATSA